MSRVFDKFYVKRMRKYGKTKDNPSLGDCQSAWAACKREILKEINDYIYLNSYCSHGKYINIEVIEKIKKL
ncbi:MAG: hypothetical protein AABY22_12520 [Nanoarchaeota archaeon]